MPALVHAGRSLSYVSVEMIGPDGKLATKVGISFVAPEAVREVDKGEASRSLPSDAGTAWRQPKNLEIPIVATLAPRILGEHENGIVTAIAIPWWDRTASTSAEAVCLAADMCVGPPVAAAFPGQWIPHPNPDVSMRFVGAVRTDEVIGFGRLERIAGGVAAVSIEVSSGDDLVAVGVSCSLLLAGG